MINAILVHTFPLRKDINVSISLPRDLTNEEVNRLIAFLETLVAIPGDFMAIQTSTEAQKEAAPE